MGVSSFLHNLRKRDTENMSSSTQQQAPTSRSVSHASQPKEQKPVLVKEHLKLDLESYVGNYRGRTRLERLYLIGTCSTVLGVDALKLGIREALKGKDINRYLQLQNTLWNIAPGEPEAQRDAAWMERSEKKNTAETHRLETELKGYKQNLVKESIRMANEELGDHYKAIGDLGKAFEAYSRMRQEVSVSKHIMDVSYNLIDVAVEQKNWIAITSNTQKIRSTMSSSSEDEKALQPFACMADGLAALDSGDYYGAAGYFLDTDAGMGAKFNTMVSPNDVATYGGLCALATMEREELHRRVLENSSFRTYLEMEPHIRRAITFFVNSRYTSCLSILEDYRADYLLDIHLRKHVEELYTLIRSKSIVQYFIPFSCVTLDSLNTAFAVPDKTIDKELAAMIQRKELNARIDTQNRLLTSLPSAPRIALQSSALSAAAEYEREARRRIQHMNIHSAELAIPANNWRGSVGGMGIGKSEGMGGLGGNVLGEMGGGEGVSELVRGLW